MHARVDPDLVRRYVDREGDGCFGDTTPSQSRRRLPEEGRDLLSLVELLESTAAADLAGFGLLRRVLREQFEVVDPSSAGGGADGRVRVIDPKAIPCGNVNNPSDPDSSYNRHRGHGYLAQVMETYQEDDTATDDVAETDDPPSPGPSQPDLITHVPAGKIRPIH